MTDDEKVRVARALYLEAFDNTASAAKAWDGDGTKDHPGHASLRDRAFRKYCDLASVAITLIQSQERERAARIAANGCLVPPDGGSPTEAEREMCEAIAAAIRSSSPTQECRAMPGIEPALHRPRCEHSCKVCGGSGTIASTDHKGADCPYCGGTGGLRASPTQEG